MTAKVSDQTWEYIAQKEPDENAEVFDGFVTKTGEPLPGLVLASVVRGEAGPLMASAPDMARVLLAIEWASYETECDGLDRTHTECPSCHASSEAMPVYEDGKVVANPVIRDADGNFVRYQPGKHTPNCALDAALRKAGVR